MGIQLYNESRYNTVHAAVSVTGDQELVLGDGNDVTILEMVSCENDSLAATNAALVTKYGITY